MQAAKRYVDCMGGISATVDKGRRFRDEGDLRFAATLLSHAVFSDQDHRTAREELASVYEKLAYGAENGTWRNIYLVGAQELRGPTNASQNKISEESMIQLEIGQLLDTMSIRLDGPRAQHEQFTIKILLSDIKENHLMRLSNGALTHRRIIEGVDEQATLSISPTHKQLVAIVLGTQKDLSDIDHEGEESVLWDLMTKYLTVPDSAFAIVTPEKLSMF